MAIAVPTTARWDLARRTADELTRPYTSPPVPVSEICAQQGLRVRFAHFGRLSDEIAGFCDFGARQIVVNEEDNFGRQMFTIAHELGHWVLHKPIFESHPEKYSVLPRFASSVKNTLEQEANAFAAELLVPKRLITPVRHAGPAELASIFGVSREMIENRLRNV